MEQCDECGCKVKSPYRVQKYDRSGMYKTAAMCPTCYEDFMRREGRDNNRPSRDRHRNGDGFVRE